MHIRLLANLISRIYVRIRSVFFVLWYRFYYGVSFGKNVRIYSGIKIYGFGKIYVGDHVIFASKTVLGTTNKEAIIEIGNKSFINGSVVCSSKKVYIGNDCILSDCELMDTSSHGIPPNKRNDPAFIKISPINIGNNSWIGSKVIILPGVTIGENSIIGVNSVVTKSIPSNVFAAGIPALVIKQIEND